VNQPITLFTGQWADLTLDEVAGLASKWGYDGLEIACSAEHLDVWRVAEDPSYLKQRQEVLKTLTADLGNLKPPHRSSGL
jgi:sugar phosphate isomerase/epimerase